MRIPRRVAVETREVPESGNLVLLDPTGAEMIVLNPVAAVIYQLMDGARDVEAIARIVADTLSAPVDRVTRDVETFVADMMARGLVREDQQ
jgi:hypothetical protein